MISHWYVGTKVLGEKHQFHPQAKSCERVWAVYFLPVLNVDQQLQHQVELAFTCQTFFVKITINSANCTIANKELAAKCFLLVVGIFCLEILSPAHRKIAADIAEQSYVLLKNDGVLPIKKLTGRVAVSDMTICINMYRLFNRLIINKP